MVLEQVAFDIETTGFDAVDVVTTVGFAVPMGVRVFLQTADRDASGIESAVESEVSETLVNVSTHASERELLVAVSEFVAERFSDGDVLRTRALGRVAERYCSKSEFKVKSLTPTRSI